MGGQASRITLFKHVTEVAAWRLCVGCGACLSVCPEQKLRLLDIVDEGIRPVAAGGDCGGCRDCVSVCPGVGIDHPSPADASGLIASLRESWGPVLEIWEGHAADADIRRDGSSGGLATALSLFCVEQMGMPGVLHVGSEQRGNKTVFSRSRAELLAATGSRYAPASPCDSLRTIEAADGPCVFVGKPCDVEAVRKAERIRPALAARLGVAIGIFCAGTPSTQGTLDLLRKYGIRPDEVEELRYRGRGWPGSFAVRLRGNGDWKELATYAEAWGFLQAYRPYRCYLCPDSTGEFADISCGDPWYRAIEGGEQGSSLVLVRSEKGRAIVRAAMAAGYVDLQPVRPEVLDLSQQELQRKRGAIWGRLLSMRALGIPAPRFAGFSLFRNWLRIPFGHKLRSLLGTLRRIVKRRYFHPVHRRA